MKINRRTPLENLPQFLSPAEYSAFVGLGLTSVYEALRRKEIPSRKLGGRRKWIPRSFLTNGDGQAGEK